MPELRHLRCFVAAAEELNFTRAAARLHVVQQSLSGTIKQLEGELGVQLFHRSTRAVRLTAAGEAFLPAARRVLEEADRAVAAVSAYAAETPHEIAVGFSFTLDEGTRWRLLERFLAEHPMARLTVHTGFSRDLLDRVQGGELDLALAFCPQDRVGIELRTVMEVPVCVVMAADHPAAARRSLRLADLRDERFVLAPEPQGAGFNEWLIDACREAGFVPETVESPSVAMSVPIGERAPGAITLAPWLPVWEATGNLVRPLDPEVRVPYAAAIRAGSLGFPRRAFEAVVASGPAVGQFLRDREAGARSTGP